MTSDQIKELRRIVESGSEYEYDLAFWSDRVNAKALLDHISQLEQKAARYDWLRNNSLRQFEHPIVVSQEHRIGEGMRYIGPLIGKPLDAAIDAAIAKSSQQDKGKEE